MFLTVQVEQQASPRVQLLDFDALSSAPDAPRGLGGTWTDWHYSCKFLWDEPEVRYWAMQRTRAMASFGAHSQGHALERGEGLRRFRVRSNATSDHDHLQSISGCYPVMCRCAFHAWLPTSCKLPISHDGHE